MDRARVPIARVHARTNVVADALCDAFVRALGTRHIAVALDRFDINAVASRDGSDTKKKIDHETRFFHRPPWIAVDG